MNSIYKYYELVIKNTYKNIIYKIIIQRSFSNSKQKLKNVLDFLRRVNNVRHINFIESMTYYGT